MFGWFRKGAKPTIPKTRLERLQQGRDNLANGTFDLGHYYHAEDNSMCAVGAMQKTYVDADEDYDSHKHDPQFRDDIIALNVATAKVTGNRYSSIESMAMRTGNKDMVLTVYDFAIMEEAAPHEVAVNA